MNAESESTVGNDATVSALSAVNPLLGIAASMANSSAKSTGSSLVSAVTHSAGNYALIGVGVVLALGALLIGSRDTVVNVSSKVARTARVFV